MTIRVVLPYHLRTLARVDGEVQVEAGTVAEALDALERAHPALRGTLRDPVTGRRRPFVRFFACREDLSHEDVDAALPPTCWPAVSRCSSSARWQAADRPRHAVIVSASRGYRAVDVRGIRSRSPPTRAWHDVSVRAPAALRGLPRETFVLALVAFCVALGFGIVVPAVPLFALEFGVGTTAAAPSCRRSR
jgi:hypothetical protein